MSDDDRPRPQFGEYATPEEQRARIKEPLFAPEPVPSLPVPVPAPTPGPLPSAPAFAPGPLAAQPLSRGRMLDRVATFGLLAYGLVNVIATLIALGDFPEYVRTVLAPTGVDATLSDPAAARGWVIAASVVLVVGWALTVWLSLASLRRGRLTWWIPVVAGIVFSLTAGVLMVVPIMGDPAIWGQLVDVG